jgi:hypothetical protein
MLELWEIPRRRDHEDVPNPTQHQRSERIVDQWLVIDRQQLLADRARDGIQARTRTARENDALSIQSTESLGEIVKGLLPGRNVERPFAESILACNDRLEFYD